MAITHFTAQIISRGEGRSAVLSAAYRHCARMEHEGEARVVDYSNKRGLIHEEFLLPADAPAWVRTLIADRSVSGAVEAFWNRVEQFEKRSDAQYAREFIIALPVEHTSEQNIALMHDFVTDQILARGQVADWVYHNEPGNPHVHLMTTLRPLTETGFGPKKIAVIGQDGQPLRNPAGKIVYRLWSGEKSELIEQRQSWYVWQNRHLALAGFDIRVDGRSYAERGIDLVATSHIGVAAKAIERQAKREGRDAELDRLRIHEQTRAENARRIVDRPDIVLDLVSTEMSVFSERDLAKILHRYVDDAGTFQQLMARILQSPDVVRLDAERMDFATGSRLPSKYTTRELIKLEAEMARRAAWLSQRNTFEVKQPVLGAVLSHHSKLSDEQRTAIEHVACDGQIAAVVGRAGAGKTTMMKAAREAWEAAGYRVVGGALAGKAAEGLEKEAGIASRTLSSWELRWQAGNDRLDDRTVFVLDEAGMVSSRQMALFVETATRTGAKLILVGDPEQLQPIEAGAAFRVIADRIGYAELQTIYRQHHQWMRDASLDLARGRVAEALSVYRQNGRVFGSELKAQAVSNLIDDWNRDYDPARTTLILAHLRRDVRALNEMARTRLVERGIVDAGHRFRTEDGDRRFAAGDQVVFLKNEGSLGVKNGMLGKIVEAGPTRFVAEVGEGEYRSLVEVNQRFYRHVDHGYATTVHKSQGATVDRVKVLASLSLDRHLTYVALTRHRQDVALYYGRRSFEKAGGLIPILSQRRAKETTLDYENGRFYRAALAYAVASILMILPPFGIVGWGHPLTAAGVLFPGWGWIGLIATATGMTALATRRWPIVVVGLGGIWVWSAACWAPPSLPRGWAGIDTQLGQSMGRGFDLEQQRLLVGAVREEAALGTGVVVLAESALGFWTPTVVRYWRTALQGSHVTVLAGASVVESDGYDNVMVAMNRDGGSPIYRQRMPVPVSMWQPWLAWMGRSGGARANLFANPIVEVAGTHVAALICYEQLITWPILQSMLDRPDVIVAIGNGWWATGTSIARIQRASALAWASLFKTPIILAFNT